MKRTHVHTISVCVSLRQEVFVRSDCLLDLGTGFLVINVVLVRDTQYFAVAAHFHDSYSSLELCCEGPWFTSIQEDGCGKGEHQSYRGNERNTPVIPNWFQPRQCCCRLCYSGKYLRLVTLVRYNWGQGLEACDCLKLLSIYFKLCWKGLLRIASSTWITLTLMYFFMVAHKAARQILLKAFLKSMETWQRSCWCLRCFSQTSLRLKSALWWSSLLWNLPVLQRWSLQLAASVCSVWASAWLCLGGPHGLTFTCWWWYGSYSTPKPTEYAHSLFCSCVYLFLWPFNCISFHKFSRQLCFLTLFFWSNSAILVFSTIYLLMKVSLSHDPAVGSCGRRN